MAPSSGSERTWRIGSLLALGTGLALVLAGAAWWSSASSGTDARVERPAPPVPELAVPRPATAAWRPGAPNRVVIPALGVAAPVRPIGTVAGTLVPPADPATLGWWAAGATPGSARGSVVVTGHTVHDGGGALDRLGSLAPGDLVVVRTAHSRLRYVVRSVAVLRKGVLAERAPRLFGQQVAGRLVLVTCTDWDGIRYLSNVVVIAAPASVQARARSDSR
jgi:hypothetical protein